MTPCTSACFAPHLCAVVGYHLRGPHLRKKWERDPSFPLNLNPKPRLSAIAAARADCVHRGEPMEPLDCCGRPATFACALHGRACGVRNLMDVRACGDCGDYTAAVPG